MENDGLRLTGASLIHNVDFNDICVRKKAVAPIETGSHQHTEPDNE
jgi:hypothetical protein